MDLPNFSHDGEHGYPTERRASHWQPALRPNGDEAVITESHPSDTQHVHSTAPPNNYSPVLPRIQFNKIRRHSPASDDEDDRLDPAWGIKRLDTAYLLEGVQRSPSFPEFSLSPGEGSASKRAFSDVPFTNSISKDNEVYASPISSTNLTGNTIQASSTPAVSLLDVVERQHPEPQFAPIEQESNSRYDEGLPLIAQSGMDVDSETTVSHFLTGTQQAQDAVLTPSRVNSGHTRSDDMPHLDRKSTTDVLESLDLGREGSDSPVGDREMPVETAIDDSAMQDEISQSANENNSDQDDAFSVFVTNSKMDMAHHSKEGMMDNGTEDLGLSTVTPTPNFESHDPDEFSQLLETDSPDKSAFDQVFADTQVDETDDFAQILEDSKPDDANAFAQILEQDIHESSDAFAQEFVQNQDKKVDDFAQILSESNTEDADAFAQILGEDKSDDADAMWKAVLEDDEDEFLVEDADDLLPDSDPGSPSSFMASVHHDRDILSQQVYSQQQHSTNATSTRAAPERRTSNIYAPHQPSTTELTQLSPKTHGNVGFTRPGLPPMNSFQAQLQRPDMPSKTESYVDQSKGGYKSPYDLPIDLAKPKKRPQAPKVPSQLKNVPPPPPRSSSISAEKQLQSPFTPTGSYFGNVAMSPPAQPSQTTIAQPSTQTPSQGGVKPKSTSTTFFEELPIAPRSRPTPGPGRYTPSQPAVIAPPQLPPSSPVVQQAHLQQPQQSPPRAPDPYTQFQLRPPEKLDPYANIPLQRPPSTSTAAQASRYSPAPPAMQNGMRPPAVPRYSPAPPPQTTAPPINRYASQPNPNSGPPTLPPQVVRQPSQTVSSMPPPTTLPFQPRTSSPLAQDKRLVNEQHTKQMPPPPVPRNVPIGSQPNSAVFPPVTPSAAPPPGLPFSPPRRPDGPGEAGFIPPRRSQTQSPGQQAPRPVFPARPDGPLNRPASALGPYSPANSKSKIAQASPPRPLVKSREVQQQSDFIMPADDTQHDPLRRWQGAPVFRFGFGGTLVSTFPKHTPRYSAGSARPQIKPGVGEVSIRKAKDFLPLSDLTASFPGPLRAKSKKKDVLNWLTTAIKSIESEVESVHLTNSQTISDNQRQLEEKLLLWKMVKILVEQDGNLDSANALQAANVVLMPEVHSLDDASATQYRSDDHLTGIYRPTGSNTKTESTDPSVVETMRKHLLKGKREDAVWLAVDNRLWSHAMLISSTLDKSVWKQVVQEFVRQEVKTIGNNAESLSALYEIFGGNTEESIDQLVPPSARAGLQMVSKVDAAGPTRNAFDGLNRWKETLCLILNNRSSDDQRALVTLGRLLADYGRVEASHICYMFSRSANNPTLFGGADEPQASMVLLGADHQARPFSFQNDQNSIMLTEVYEFAVNILGGSSTTAMAHLCVYKLQRANCLAEAGMKTEAQAYCDAIAAGLKANTKLSPYYHPVLLGEVEELATRLKQAPLQSSSWIAKPSIEKVSGSVWTKFTSFVAGDDSDAESRGSGRDAAEAGPFANVSGSPSLSRTTSQTDLYGSYPSATSTYPATATGSRYAPNGISSARSSSELTRGRPSFEMQRSPPSTSYSNDSRPAFTSMLQQQYQPQDAYSPTVVSSPPAKTYQSSRPQSHSQYMPNVAETPGSPQRQDEFYQPQRNVDAQPSYMPSTQPLSEPGPAEREPAESEQPSYGGYTATQASFPSAHEQTTSQSLQEPEPLVDDPFGVETTQSSYGYQPPDDGGYVPYEPEPEPDSDDEKKKPKSKKKSFMDDDDDEFSTVAQAPKAAVSSSNSGDDAARKKANDEAAEAAFRAAAEADAARAKEREQQKKASGSWLGGWFAGGKKNPDGLDNAPASSSKGADQKVYKAKLGESKMKLYYDKDLKKWVNPDNPDASKPKSTPPPPRTGTPGAGPPSGAGPPRSVSNLMGSAPPSRSSTPAGAESDASRPGSSNVNATLPPNVAAGLGLNGTGTPPPTGGLTPPSGPPTSRPVSSMSNAGGLDDLLGAPTGGARRGAARSAKGKKGGRYVDIMQQ